jgi:hypothetical protein
VTAFGFFGPGPEFGAFDQPVLFYVDAGTTPTGLVQANNLQGLELTLTGYMLDCTVAPCAAIAH